jgi:hypothetical protein
LPSGTWNYKILKDNKVVIDQQGHKPCVSGFQTMTEAEANAIAKWLVARHNEQRTPAQDEEFQGLRGKIMTTCPNCGQPIPIKGVALSAGQQATFKRLQSVGVARLVVAKVNEICAGAQ